MTDPPMYTVASAVLCCSLAIVRSLPLPGCDCGDQKNDMAGYEDFVYILERGKTKLDSFWGVISMQFWVLS